MTLDAKTLLAVERAMDRGAALLRRGREHVGSVIPKGDRDYATEIDLRIEATIRQTLGEATPEIPFLGEEGGGAPIDAGRMWVLDPIDGTVNFSNSSPLCAIALALIERGEPTLGVVDLPLLGERYVARRGMGAYVNGRRIRVVEGEPLDEAVIGFADFAVGSAAEVENRIHRELMGRLAKRTLRVRVHGSASLDLAWLAAGRLNGTVMLSNLPWDVSAGVLLVREAGGETYDYDGSGWSPHSAFTLASTGDIAREMLGIVQEAIEAVDPSWPPARS